MKYRFSVLVSVCALLLCQNTFAQSLKLSDFLTNAASQKLPLPDSEAQRFKEAFDTDFLADLANRRMFVSNENGLAVYKMGIGRPAAHIPYGKTKITVKRRNPVWTPTPEARVRNPFLPRSVLASADNPLGSRAMNTTWQYYLLHGTNDHEKIGRAATWGCMSLAEKDIAEVFETTRKGYEMLVYKAVDFSLATDTRVGIPTVKIVRPKPKPQDLASDQTAFVTIAVN